MSRLVRSILGMMGLCVLAACGTVLTPLPASGPDGSAIVRTATPTFSPNRFTTPLPPTPTYTPAPTPTPIIYVVQSGDTLLGIAIQYGVTLDALQRANAIADPRFLQAGQSLVIPTGDEAEGNLPVFEQQLLPTPTPVPVQVQGVTLYPSPVGGVWCVGEVVNPTASPLTNVQLDVALTTADGTALMRLMTLLSADYIPAGERAPFAVLFNTDAGSGARCLVSLMRAETITPITDLYRPLSVSDSQGAPQGPRYMVRGRLVNQQPETLQRPNVVVTFYDKRGRVLGYRHQVLRDRALALGEAADFELVFTPPASDMPATFRIIAWGELGD